MKLIVAGASGFVATELIRQSLSIAKITSVISLSRRPIPPVSNLDHGADVSKLQSVLVDDDGSTRYPDDVKKKLAGADACIWTVAITPTKARGVDFEEVRRVCQEYALTGLQVMFEVSSEDRSSGAQPFRFIYMSGTAAERDQKKTPSWMPQYCLMRGETENRALAFAADHKDALEVCVAKPGLITGPGLYLKNIGATLIKFMTSVPNVDVTEVSAAMLHEVMHGFEKEPLQNDDLVRIGRRALKMDE